MISKTSVTNRTTAWEAYPKAGTGTQADPFDWPTAATVSGTTSTLTIASAGEWESTTAYAKLTLSAGTYNWSISGMDEMDAQAYIYNSAGTQVAASSYDWENSVWVLELVVAAEATFTFKISAFSYGSTMSTSVTPLPTAVTPYAARGARLYATEGVNGYGRLMQFASIGDAGLSSSLLLASRAWLMLHLDGSINDSGASLRTDITNGGGWTGAGKFDGAATLDNQAIVIPYINNPFAADFTIQCWVKLNGAGRMCVMALADDQYIGIDNNGGNWNMWAGAGSWSILQGDTDDSSPTGSSGMGTVAATTGVWTHLAYVHYGDQWVLFVNGAESRRKTRSGSITYTDKAIRLGKWGGDVFNANMAIDEFRIDTRAVWRAPFTPPTAAYK